MSQGAGQAGHGNTVVVEARHLSLSFRANPVLVDVDLALEAATELAITGRSGSGKTSLLLVLAGLLKPEGGTVHWPGLDPDPVTRRGQIAMVFQAPSLLPELSALENVTLPLRLRGQPVAPADDSARAALSHLGFNAGLGSLPHELSGGQQQRVAVARSIAGHPKLILADEPTGALDSANARIVVQTLRQRAAAEGSCLVLATHDEELAAMFGWRAVIDDGSIRWPQ